MNIRLIAIITLSCCIGWTALPGQNTPADAKAKLSKWVETRQIISEEKADWAVEEEFLKSTRDLLQEQVKALQEEIEGLNAQTTESDEKRNELLLERAKLQRAGTAMEEQIAQLEGEVKSLVKRFPAPLQDKLEPLIVRIPDNPEETDMALGQRLITVLGILGQAEKFNSTANFYGETREVGGQRIQVNTVYWGMAFAVYVDTNGKTAGFGRPGPDGWVWTEDNSIAKEAKLFVDMYQGNVDIIEFVQLPVTIQ